MYHSIKEYHKRLVYHSQFLVVIAYKKTTYV